MRFTRVAVVVVMGITFIAACSNYSTGSYSGGHGNSITVSNNSFNPTPDTAAAGAVTFTWTNASNSHNVTWLTGPAPLPDSSGTKTSGTFQPTLQHGTYTYHCTIHPGMNGTIVVP